MHFRFAALAVVSLVLVGPLPGQSRRTPPKAVAVEEGAAPLATGEEATPGAEEKLTDEEKKALEAEKAKEKEKPAVMLGADGKPLPPEEPDPRGALEKALADNLLSMGKNAELVKTKARVVPPEYYLVYIVSAWDPVAREKADELAGLYRQGLKNHSLPFEVIMVVKNAASDVAEQYFKKGNWPFALLVPEMQRPLTTLLNLDRTDSSPMLMKVDREGLLISARQADLWDDTARLVAQQGEPPPEPVAPAAKPKKTVKSKKK